MNNWLIWISILYLGLMFFIAYWAEKNTQSFKKSFSSGWMYALSLAVFCSAWTFYGSIGKASGDGLTYLAIYLGPTLAMPLWWIVTRKIIKITKDQHISSISDFLASRYGKDQKTGTVVAVLVLLAVTPYIALQLKAIAESFRIAGSESYKGIDLVLIAGIFLCIFTLLYGTRYIAANKPKRGMVTVVAVESVVKLFAFLIGAGILIYGYMDTSVSTIFTQSKSFGFDHLFTFNSTQNFTDWGALLLVSTFAILLLPRQFQVGVIENTNTQHLKKAMWVFPLYLLLINLFVFPLALSGKMILGDSISSDYYFLGLATHFQANWLSILIYVGGFSAATSMIIVSSISLGGMLSTNVILPSFIKKRGDEDVSQRILFSRRVAVVLIFILAYAYYKYLANETPLVSIGITSFIGVAQLAPAFFGGLYWKGASKKGALSGIIGGFIIWFYSLILPSIISAIGIDIGFSYLLDPQHLLGLDISPTTAVILLSLTVNSLLFIGVSIFSNHTQGEENQSKVFVEAMEISTSDYNKTSIWQGSVPFPDIKSLLIRFLGDRRTEEVLDRYARINGVNFTSSHQADAKVISYAERLLTEVIGPASARIMIKSVVKEEEISIVEVVDILKESKEVLQLNKELRQKSQELKLASQELQMANEQLTKYADLKDEFLYTVTHELRTPLTSIRTQAEVIQMDDDMPVDDRKMFISNIVKDCERLTKLITHVLDLEKFESGNQKLSLTKMQINDLIEDATRSLNQLSASHKIEIHLELDKVLPNTFVDEDRISQVLINLISNAIKFADNAKGEILISSYEENNSIRVDVSDNGAGMSQEDKELVFDKFYQVKDQTRKKPTGSGLGLAICKNIIQMHQGKIWVDHSDDSGTCVSFTLPIYANLSKTNNTVYEENFDR